MRREISDPIEKIVADGLAAAGIRFVHESESKDRTFALDFYLPDFCIFIECKQFWSAGLSEQMKRCPNTIAIQGREAAHTFARMIVNQQTRAD